MALAKGEWHKLPLTLSELCLSSVLRCGQSFRWKASNPGEWTCALNGRILMLRQDESHLHYRVIFPAGTVSKKDDTVELIRDYFNLDINLTKLYEGWGAADAHFLKKAVRFAGIRMLRQDPWENLVSFICSSNNNILRISQMVDKLCTTFGPKLGEVDGHTYHDFPPPGALMGDGTEQTLRELGFGYRAKYISTTARMIAQDRPVGWLDGLRKVDYRDAHEALLELSGVGPKVADCVCLMSLDKTEAVPVDTHVWQIAQRDYGFGRGKHKSLTKATYEAIGDHFRKLWGQEAGWAHSVLFTADLKAFADVKTEEVKVEGVRVEKTTTTKKKTTTTTRKVKTEKIKDEPGDDNGGEGVKPDPALVGDDKENAVEEETVVVQKVVRKAKRSLKLEVGEEGENVSLELEGVTTLAERVKRRRRR
ncbi:DNA glycosylase [Choiromyces venosus 120613-1]|uniref:N-glycosylase/DNA lyase n=1 Tax=Choiromyces venosus 120613-1 TaxID=1336337 RepID=A0A3N4JGP2_9PEZI|nr:DNA glycosylase [Choiromyces venosus 120613-1]